MGGDSSAIPALFIVIKFEVLYSSKILLNYAVVDLLNVVFDLDSKYRQISMCRKSFVSSADILSLLLESECEARSTL